MEEEEDEEEVDGGGAKIKENKSRKKFLNFIKRCSSRHWGKKIQSEFLKRSKRLWKFLHPRWADLSSMKTFLCLKGRYFFLFDGKFINRNFLRCLKWFFCSWNFGRFWKNIIQKPDSIKQANKISCQKNVKPSRYMKRVEMEIRHTFKNL